MLCINFCIKHMSRNNCFKIFKFRQDDRNDRVSLLTKFQNSCKIASKNFVLRGKINEEQQINRFCNINLQRSKRPFIHDFPYVYLTEEL